MEVPKLESTREQQEQVERRRQLRGLAVLLFVALAFSIARAGVDRVFPHLWWKPW